MPSNKDVLGYLGIGGILMFLFYNMANKNSSSMNSIPNSSSYYQAPHEDPPWWRSSWEFIKRSFQQDLEDLTDFWSI